jgi:hypothetical protein
MENKIPTAEEFLLLMKDEDFTLSKSGLKVSKMMIEFAKLHVEKIKDLQQSKYYSGETGYIKKEEWEELLTNIK